MKSLPPVTIVCITYNRPIEIRATMTALYNRIFYDGVLKYYIADDCSPNEYGFKILDWWNKFAGESKNSSLVTTPSNSGWGVNANNVLSCVKDDIVLFLEDDYVLSENLDITPYVVLLLVHQGIGLVRLDGIAGHRIVCHINETDLRDYLPTYRQGMGMPGKLNYFLLDSNSRELWLYSNRPHLKHRRFHKFYGKYPEGLRLGATEESFSHTVKDGMASPNAPAIAVPLDATGWWDHIGVSYQFSEHDKTHEIVK